MKRNLLIFLLAIISHNTINAQTRISGYVKDAVSGEVLIGAHIQVNGSLQAVCTDRNGYFSLVSHNSEVIVSFIGYEQKILKLQQEKDTLIHVVLQPGTELSEVVVKAPKRIVSNVATLSKAELTSIPSLGAKPDVMKSIQLLPGIQSQNEGSSLIMVRGGNPGENLYLIDNIPLIYVNHLGGFMSVFNPDMINNVDVYKGGFPARYGGKLSSIMDITQREGNQSGFKGSLGIGLTDASFTFEGPLPLKNSTFIVSGRKTLTEPLFYAATSFLEGNDFNLIYGFHDINGKFTWKPNAKNSLHLNIYQGDDYLVHWSGFEEENSNSSQNAKTANIWGNWLASARWKHLHSARLYSVNSLSWSRYRLRKQQQFESKEGSEVYGFDNRYISSVQDLSLRSDWKYRFFKNWSLDFGLQSSFVRHMPNNVIATNQAIVHLNTILNTFENAFYAENKIRFFKYSELNIGLRAVHYNLNDYHDFSLEPRLNLSIGLNSKHKLNVSYMDVSQNAHLLFTSNSFMNNEVWVPADKEIPAAKSRQYTAGYTGNFYNNMFQLETNIYLKDLNQLADYKPGYSNLLGDANWRSKIATGGSGKSVGAEFFLRKNYGKWTGFISYAWSHTTRKFPEINNGNEFLFDYDRPHTTSISISRKLNDKLSLDISNRLTIYPGYWSPIYAGPKCGRTLLLRSHYLR